MDGAKPVHMVCDDTKGLFSGCESVFGSRECDKEGLNHLTGSYFTPEQPTVKKMGTRNQ